MVLITSINARQIRLPVARRPEICAGARQPTLITTRPGNMIEVQGYSQIRYRHITGSVQSRQLLSRAASKHARHAPRGVIHEDPRCGTESLFPDGLLAL